jgi:cytidine deaminase
MLEKFPLSVADHELVNAAIERVRKPVLHFTGEREPALVGSALRLDDGDIITAVNLLADVGSLSLCAEPLAIAEARLHVDRKIETIVAVYYHEGQAPRVIPPCGRCREIITDFASEGFVILRDPGADALFRVRAAELLPLKYAEFWREGVLV